MGVFYSLFCPSHNVIPLSYSTLQLNAHGQLCKLGDDIILATSSDFLGLPITTFLTEELATVVFTCPAEKRPTLRRSWVLQIPQLPQPLKWCSSIYLSFLSGMIQFFLFTLLFFVRLHISSVWRGQWWGIFLLLHHRYRLQFKFELTR